MSYLRLAYPVFALQLLLLAGCSPKPSTETSATEMESSLSAEQIRRVAGQRIVFAHQSVGGNILDGISVLATEKQVALNITDVTRSDIPSGKGFLHFKVGTNGDPQGKISEFEKRLSSNEFPSIDVAMLKLCYIDFNRDVDAEDLAGRYVDALNRLQSHLPQTRVIGFTAPLTTIQTGPKAWVKRLLGKEPAGLVENARREQFNRAVRARIPTNRLFDLANIEATGGPTPYTMEYQGHQVVALDPALSSDGGHLNARGERLLAAQLLQYLAGGSINK